MIYIVWALIDDTSQMEGKLVYQTQLERQIRLGQFNYDCYSTKILKVI